MSNRWTFYIAFALMLSMAALKVQAQPGESTAREANAPVYHVDYWVSVPIIVAGGVSGAFYLNFKKPLITDAELAQVNPNNVPSFDRVALHQDMSQVPTWDKYASAGQLIGAAMPVLLLLDKDVRSEWLPVVTMGIEANMVELGMFTLSPIGPRFIDRYRPLVYYPKAAADAAGINQQDGINKSSFYSGHVASVAVSSFFMAKVYSDFHPDADPYVVYGLAGIPPLAMGYIRLRTLDHFPSDIAVGFAIGAAIGVLDPELHHIHDDGLSMGFFSNPTQGTGLSLAYTPPETASR